MGPAGATTNANAITNVNVNLNASVSANVNSMRQFRYLLHFRQGAWQGEPPITAISAAQRCRVRLHLLATFCSTLPPASLQYPLSLPILPFSC